MWNTSLFKKHSALSWLLPTFEIIYKNRYFLNLQTVKENTSFYSFSTFKCWWNDKTFSGGKNCFLNVILHSFRPKKCFELLFSRRNSSLFTQTKIMKHKCVNKTLSWEKKRWMPNLRQQIQRSAVWADLTKQCTNSSQKRTINMYK